MMVNKKLNLDRFKRSMQGVIDFAALIEQADPTQREKIIGQAVEQDSDFIFRVMRKVVFFEELIYIEEAILAEILSKTSPKVLAYALYGMPDSFRTLLLKQIGHRDMRLFKDEEERLGASVTPSLIRGAQVQILKIARQLESQNMFTFELSDCPRFKQKKKAG